MKRRELLKCMGVLAAAGGMSALSQKALAKAGGGRKKPNVIFILADDLGYAELGCYGQKKIKTPNIDKIAAEGMRFTDHYSGHAVCAPSRCTLLTGLHTGHSHVRQNLGRPIVGQLPLPANTTTLPRLLKKQGYTTACVGKWGLGGPNTTGVPWKQGVDHFFGYLDQWRAHSYYPTYLYRNDKKVPLDNPDFKSHQRIKAAPEDPKQWDKYKGKDYAPDKMIADALQWIRTNKDKPFFLYFATPVPHVSIQVPDTEESLEAYRKQFGDKPYLGDKGYLPYPAPRAGYAAMITRMDRHVGKIMALLKELGLDDDTIVMFASDNGPTFNGGSDSQFFNSAGPLKGLKCSMWEGGIRVPMIARWPGKIKPKTVTNLPSAFWDVMPTVLELTGAKADTPEEIDGISFAPTLLSKPGQKAHEYLYWETHGGNGGVKAVRMGDWKGYCKVNKEGKGKIQLYNLKTDIGETKNVAAAHPEIVAKIQTIMTEGRSTSPYFNFGGPAPGRDEWIRKNFKPRKAKKK